MAVVFRLLVMKLKNQENLTAKLQNSLKMAFPLEMGFTQLLLAKFDFLNYLHDFLVSFLALTTARAISRRKPILSCKNFLSKNLSPCLGEEDRSRRH